MTDTSCNPSYLSDKELFSKMRLSDLLLLLPAEPLFLARKLTQETVFMNFRAAKACFTTYIKYMLWLPDLPCNLGCWMPSLLTYRPLQRPEKQLFLFSFSTALI